MWYFSSCLTAFIFLDEMLKSLECYVGLINVLGVKAINLTIADSSFIRESEALLSHVNYEVVTNCWRSCESLCSSNLSCNAFTYQQDQELCRMSNVTRLLHISTNMMKSTVYLKTSAVLGDFYFGQPKLVLSGKEWKLNILACVLDKIMSCVNSEFKLLIWYNLPLWNSVWFKWVQWLEYIAFSLIRFASELSKYW